MIQEFVEAFEKNKASIREHFEKETPQTYFDVVKNVITHLNTGRYSDPDPGRIEQIDHGDYQGTLALHIVQELKEME